MGELTRVLLIENDPEVMRFICRHLLAEGYEVEATESGSEGLALALSSNRSYELILLAIMLPDISGYDILEDLRGQKVSTPVMVISGLTRVEEVVKGLDLGADDYLRKPFDKREMTARIRAILRRVNKQAKE